MHCSCLFVIFKNEMSYIPKKTNKMTLLNVLRPILAVVRMANDYG